MKRIYLLAILIVCQTGTVFAQINFTDSSGVTHKFKFPKVIAELDDSIDFIPNTNIVSHAIPKGARNLIVNGDFSQGSIGFITAYKPESFETGGFVITKKPVDINRYFKDVRDHTTGSGNMMAVDGSKHGEAAIVWGQTVTVKPESVYVFSISAANLYESESYKTPTLVVRINNKIVIEQTLPTGDMTGEWQQYEVHWNTGKATTLSISVTDTCREHFNNDFAIDDIQLYQRK